jgi:hypothetical protein
MGCAARFLIVTRLARVIAVDVPHHVTQRGNGRRFILDCDADRMAYLNLLRQNIELHGVGLIGYCLILEPVWMRDRANWPLHQSKWRSMIGAM